MQVCCLVLFLSCLALSCLVRIIQIGDWKKFLGAENEMCEEKLMKSNSQAHSLSYFVFSNSRGYIMFFESNPVTAVLVTSALDHFLSCICSSLTSFVSGSSSSLQSHHPHLFISPVHGIINHPSNRNARLRLRRRVQRGPLNPTPTK